MLYRVSEISLSADEYRDENSRMDHIRRKVIRKIKKAVGGGRTDEVTAWIGDITILRESVDARKKPDVRAVFTVAFESRARLPFDEYEGADYDPVRELPAFDDNGTRPVIAGFGPCGMFAALVLALAGARPIVLERGRSMQARIEDVERFWDGGELDPESNVQFGEGGAGTFSDGKLTTGLKNRRISWILKQFVEGGADPAIAYRAKPHIGTDRLRTIVPNIRERIKELGGEVRFSTRLEDVESRDGRLTGLTASRDGRIDRIPADILILATGHSAEDTFRMLLDHGIEMGPKPFSIGLRIEHPQEEINRAQYADPDLAEVFGPAEYKLNHRCANGRGVYTFCMCPGGRVINAASSPGHTLTNGMSDMARDGCSANSGLLVDVRIDDFEIDDDPLSGVAFQKKYERLAWEAGRGTNVLPTSTYGAFRDDEDDVIRTCIPGFATESILEAMPHLGRKLDGFDSDKARLFAVETRSSSPVRIKRDDNMNSSIRGIIPAGEGPGYAGGIVSAALDGIRAAETVLRGEKIGE